MQKILYIPVDTTLDNTVECTKLIKRGDTLTLQIKVFSNGALANLTGQSIDLIFKKSDGTIIEKVIDTSNISNGVITAIPGQQSTLVEGVVSGEVQIYTDDTLSSTNTFTFIVSSSIADDVLEVSQNDIQVLADLRNLINDGEVTIEQYENSVLAIGNSVGAIEALANIKLYIDTNLPALESENAKAVVNIVNEKVENDRADINIVTLGELNNNAAILTQLLATLTSENDEATSNISSLTTKNNTAASNITELDAKNSTASTNKTNLDSANTRAEANIVALENFGDATQLVQDVNAVKIEVETARNGEASLDARLDKNDVLVANHSTQLSEKANNTDNTRTTADKTVTGAINELNANLGSYSKAVKVTRLSAQSIANATSTAISWDGVVLDNNSFWDTNNKTKLTVKTPGLYEIKASASFDVNATGIRSITIRFNNATDIARDIRIPITGGYTTVSVSTIQTFANITDYVEVYVQHTAGTSISITNQTGDIFFSVKKVG